MSLRTEFFEKGDRRYSATDLSGTSVYSFCPNLFSIVVR